MIMNIISGVMVFFLLVSGDVEAKNNAAQEADVDRLFQEVAGGDMPGCAVGVFGQGRTLFLKGYGMASLEQDRSITPQSLFTLGSTSKQFAAAAIGMAELEGLLSLDDDVRKYIPELPDYRPDSEKAITIRQLIYHTSGLRDYLSLRWIMGLPPENSYSNDWVMALIARQKDLNFTPGDHYSYSNSGYFLLGEIIKRATGKTLNDYSREKLFLPLGMKNTHFHDDRRAVHKNRTMAYLKAPDGRPQLEWYPNFDKVGAGGLMTSAEDLLLWEKNFHADQLAGGRLISLMMSPGALASGAPSNYGFGLIHGKMAGLALVKHRGAYMGYRAQILRFPDQKLSIFLMCNLGNLRPEKLAEQVAQIFLPELLKKQSAKVITAEPGRDLTRYEGSYRDIESRYILSFKAQEDALQVLGAPFPLSLIPVADQGFVANAGPVDVDVLHLPARQVFKITIGGLFAGDYEKVDLATPSCDELDAYRGRYYSAELNYIFRLSVQQCRLFLEREDMPPLALNASTKDAFRSGMLALEFERKGGGEVTSLKVSSLRVHQVTFEKEGL